MMKEISADFKNRATKELFYGSWGESYEKDILMIADYFSKHTIFVYGTLMAGQTTHKPFLANANYLGDAYVYNHSVADFEEVKGKYGKDEYVWYVAYGSNLLEERMKYYIQGGFCKYNGRTYSTFPIQPFQKHPVPS